MQIRLGDRIRDFVTKNMAQGAPDKIDRIRVLSLWRGFDRQRKSGKRDEEMEEGRKGSRRARITCTQIGVCEIGIPCSKSSGEAVRQEGAE